MSETILPEPPKLAAVWEAAKAVSSEFNRDTLTRVNCEHVLDAYTGKTRLQAVTGKPQFQEGPAFGKPERDTGFDAGPARQLAERVIQEHSGLEGKERKAALGIATSIRGSRNFRELSRQTQIDLAKAIATMQEGPVAKSPFSWIGSAFRTAKAVLSVLFHPVSWEEGLLKIHGAQYDGYELKTYKSLPEDLRKNPTFLLEAIGRASRLLDHVDEFELSESDKVVLLAEVCKRKFPGVEEGKTLFDMRLDLNSDANRIWQDGNAQAKKEFCFSLNDKQIKDLLALVPGFTVRRFLDEPSQGRYDAVMREKVGVGTDKSVVYALYRKLKGELPRDQREEAIKMLQEDSKQPDRADDKEYVSKLKEFLGEEREDYSLILGFDPQVAAKAIERGASTDSVNTKLAIFLLKTLKSDETSSDAKANARTLLISLWQTLNFEQKNYEAVNEIAVGLAADAELLSKTPSVFLSVIVATLRASRKDPNPKLSEVNLEKLLEKMSEKQKSELI